MILLPLFGITRSLAGTFSSRKVTISDSRSGQTGVQYDFAFTATVSTAIKQWTIQFCNESAATGTCTTPTGLVTTSAVRSADNVSGTARTDTFTTNGTLTTVVTTPAVQSPLAITASYTTITNPTTANTTFFARITTYSDLGVTTIDGTNNVAFAVLTSTSIAVTATVDTNFTFTVAAVASAATVNGATTNITTTATTIPLGTLASGSTRIGAHDLTLTTNGLGGYQVTVKQASATAPLTGAVAGNKIDPFTGTNAAPALWSSPTGTVQNTNTGFFGYTTNDATLSGASPARFTTTANVWAGSTTTASEVAFNSTDVNAQITRVGWQAEVNSIQPADSYSGTVVLVATPTY